MPSEQGHYFELTGFCGSEWFELRIYSERYDLLLGEADINSMKPQAEQAGAGQEHGDTSIHTPQVRS